MIGFGSKPSRELALEVRSPHKRTSIAVEEGKEHHGLSLYDTPPDGEVTTEDLVQLATGRLTVLQLLDRFDQPAPKYVSEGRILVDPVRDAMQKHGLLPEFAPSLSEAEYRRRDAISHFILRLALCKTRDLREWFVKQEHKLFYIRMEVLRPEVREPFLAELQKSGYMTCTPAGREESEDVATRTPYCVPGEAFFKIPFTEVPPNMLSRRQVVLKAGKAFVPRRQLSQIVVNKFRDSLREKLSVAFNGLPKVLRDNRMGELLTRLSMLNNVVGPSYSAKDSLVERMCPENFDMLLTRSVPPCMRMMVDYQREGRTHLKHQGRLALRPFLRVAGMEFQESMRWWRAELGKCKGINGEVFEKNYKYDIEHTYAGKGHMKLQNPYSCSGMLNLPAPSAGQCHGCPFKVLDQPNLRKLMMKWKIPAPAVEAMIGRVQGNHHQLACVEYFKATHPGHDGDGVGNHPNQFFNQSCQHYKDQAEKAKAA